MQRAVLDSIAKANPPRPQAAKTEVAAVAPAAATAPATVSAPAAAPAAAPEVSGPKRVAITEPKESSQAALNSFSRTLTDALRGSLSKEGGFTLVDQDSVRSALAKAPSREDIVKLLQPDVLISHTYAGVGDTVSIIVTVRDLRSNSSYGIRVTSAQLIASQSQYYLGPILQSILKQIDDLSRAPTIYRKK
jgi:hypothetical protein